ncbi:MAG: secretin N-terminal domain-containing protein [Candidatus Omnitrophota bacterium]
MIKRIILIILCTMLFPIGLSFSQEEDNTFGEDLIYSFSKNISLDLESARLEDVLKMVSQQTGLNFISAEEVKDRKLTLYIENIPLRKAIDIIFKVNNLTYDYYPESNIFTVKETGRAGLELKTKVYHLKYARLPSSNIRKEATDKLGSEGGGDTGIKAAVERVVSELGKVIEDPATNALVVIDIPAQFSFIDEIIEKLDIPALKVMVEVEMLDVSKVHLDKIGFNFSNGVYATYTPGARSSFFPFDRSLFKNANIQDTSGGSTPPLLGVLDFTSFTAVLQLLSEETSTKFIARPKILTLSNETAEVNLTSNEVIGITTTEADSGSTQEIEREETGTKLRVTPQVASDTDEVTLFVEMFNKESVDSGISVTNITTGNVKNVEERGTKSLVRLKDGETLLIGGLIKEKDVEIVRKIPFLSDIPFIGKIFFTYRERSATDNIERELLVFVTPHIIKEPALAKTISLLNREQQNTLKAGSMKGTLDKFSK